MKATVVGSATGSSTRPGVTAQVSLYPLRQPALAPAIDEAQRIFRAFGLDVRPGSMSTMIDGGRGPVFGALYAAFEAAAGQGEVVMTVTLSNACPVPDQPEATSSRPEPVPGPG